MEIQSLWRLRRTLFIVLAIILFLVPIYTDLGGTIILRWYWGDLCIVYCGHAWFLAMPWWYNVFQASIPGGLVVIGIIGCQLTKDSITKGMAIPNSPRYFTQISVTGFLFIELYVLVNHLIESIYLALTEGAHLYLYFPVNALCALPVTVILMIFSFDFPHFKALDFAQERPTLERSPEGLSSQTTKQEQEMGDIHGLS